MELPLESVSGSNDRNTDLEKLLRFDGECFKAATKVRKNHG